MPTGDLFHGGHCVFNPPTVAEGALCNDSSGTRNAFVCLDGLQCDYQVPIKNPNGTNLCRQLCFLPGGGYDADGGTLPDGGMVAGPCPIGKTCTDVFGEAGNSRPETRVGLCL
jgi:hypothetical protein